eukprot:TRINITY_DN103349_c0_g1_i1.p1 TRINITY_DN103349_c0_g1~~TRINITY_DN103349_c0_g1_i1.p1  ORF type:complete len:396 (-),score=95.73 TRINITY_DN103349_c0_g1_i1:291-1478(-)
MSYLASVGDNKMSAPMAPCTSKSAAAPSSSCRLAVGTPMRVQMSTGAAGLEPCYSPFGSTEPMLVPLPRELQMPVKLELGDFLAARVTADSQCSPSFVDSSFSSSESTSASSDSDASCRRRTSSAESAQARLSVSSFGSTAPSAMEEIECSSAQPPRAPQPATPASVLLPPSPPAPAAVAAAFATAVPQAMNATLAAAAATAANSKHSSQWWTKLALLCPLTEFPIAMLPYPPFKFRVDANSPNSVALVDGKSLAMQVILSDKPWACGRALQTADMKALDAYIHRCKLGAFQPSRAAALKKKFEEAQDEAERSRAHMELEQFVEYARSESKKLRRIQQNRLIRAQRDLQGAAPAVGQMQQQHQQPQGARCGYQAAAEKIWSASKSRNGQLRRAVI